MLFVANNASHCPCLEVLLIMRVTLCTGCLFPEIERLNTGPKKRLNTI